MWTVRGQLVAGALLGVSSVGSGTIVVDVGLAALGAGVCFAWRRGGSVAVGAALLAAALAAGRLETGREPELERATVVVARAEEAWRVQGGESTRRVRAEVVRQRGSARVWRRPMTLVWNSGEPPPADRRLRVKGLLRRTSSPSNFGVAPRPDRLRLTVVAPALLEPIPDRSLSSSFWRLSERLRSGVDRALERRELAESGERGAGSEALFRALVLGDRTALPAEWLRAFERTGVAHVLSVSGLHVGLLLGAVYRLCAPFPATGRSVAGGVALIGYLLLVGPRPSLVRAALMGGAALASVSIERPRSVGWSLVWAALALLLWQPLAVRDLGFRLTCGATAAIVWVTRRRTDGASSGRPRLLEGAAVTVAAQAASLFFLLPVTGIASPWALLLHGLILPWTALSLAASWIWLALGLRATALGRSWEAVPQALSSVPRELSEWPATVLPASIGLAPSLAALFGAGVLAWWSRAGALAPRRRVGLVTAAGVVVWIVAGSAGRGGSPAGSSGSNPAPADGLPEIVFLDVGQGDAILVRDGDESLLIDGGGWPRGDVARSILLPALAGLGVGSLGAALPTHADRDHCGGLLQLTWRVPVRRVYLAPAAWEGGCTRALALDAPGTVGFLWAGAELGVGRWRLRVLSPMPGDREGGNDGSIVLRASVFGRSALLTGDVESETERTLVERYRAGLRSDVLKLAHHGSKTSTTPAWLDAVRPRVAVATVGRRNPYGHPASVVRDRLASAAVPLLRTDLAGAVRLRITPDSRLLFDTATVDVPPEG